MKNGLIDSSSPIHSFWLNTDPKYRGDTHDFEEFSWNDHNITWKHTVEVKTKNPSVPKLSEQTIHFKFDHVSEYDIQIKVVKGKAIAMVKYKDVTYMINSVFVDLDVGRLTTLLIQPWKWKNAGREILKEISANVVNMSTRKGETIQLK